MQTEDNAVGSQAAQAEAERLFKEHFGTSAQTALAWAPGRVNLIGEYTDFNEGFVLPLAVDRGIAIVARRRSDREMRVVSGNVSDGGIVSFSLDKILDDSVPSWARYVGGVVETMCRDGHIDSGIDAAIYGNLPMGGGLSSSAALEVATATVLEAVFGIQLAPVETALLCQATEHRYAGVRCGVMDQFASRLGKPDHALLIDCRSLSSQEIPLPTDGATVVIIDSRVPRELASSAYNERVEQCEEAVRGLQAAGFEVASLRDAKGDMVSVENLQLTGPVLQRCRHVVSENQRVKDAVIALKHNQIAALGELLYASHTSLRDDMQVSCTELDFIVDHARDHAGVIGARMTGAGFGGNTVALIERDAVDSFADSLVSAYSAAFGHKPECYVMGEVTPAQTIRSLAAS